MKKMILLSLCLFAQNNLNASAAEDKCPPAPRINPQPTPSMDDMPSLDIGPSHLSLVANPLRLATPSPVGVGTPFPSTINSGKPVCPPAPRINPQPTPSLTDMDPFDLDGSQTSADIAALGNARHAVNSRLNALEKTASEKSLNLDQIRASIALIGKKVELDRAILEKKAAEKN